MKKVTLFAIILSLSSFLMVGCSKSDEDVSNSVNKDSTVKADFSKPASPDNPGGKKLNAPN